jgi:hypothetical protein
MPNPFSRRKSIHKLLLTPDILSGQYKFAGKSQANRKRRTLLVKAIVGGMILHFRLTV